MLHPPCASCRHPFRVAMPEEAITDLRRRIAATRWPTRELVADRSQGVQLATIRELARYWARDYDWRAWAPLSTGGRPGVLPGTTSSTTSPCIGCPAPGLGRPVVLGNGRAPRSWVEKSYPHLTYFNEVDKGGHFAAWEQPEVFSAELRAAFRSLR